MNHWLFFEIAKAADTIDLPDAPTYSGSANANVAAFLNRIATLLLTLAIPLAIIGVIYAAYALITANGKPDGYAKAKKYLLAVATGIFIIVFAAIMVRLSYNLFK
jgi:hypothetical protein